MTSTSLSSSLRYLLSNSHVLIKIFHSCSLEDFNHPFRKCDLGVQKSASKKPGSPPEEPAPIQHPIPEPVPKVPTTNTLRQSCAIRARRFISSHFATSSGGPSLETEGVILLKGLCKNLNKPDAIGQILQALKATDGGEVSTFEFLKSGTVQELRKYLLGNSSLPVLCLALSLHLDQERKDQSIACLACYTNHLHAVHVTPVMHAFLRLLC